MKIAIASGKGGTGKTTVATNLALAATAKGLDTVYMDCDVEEPNGALFLKPKITQTEDVNVTVPAIDNSKCTACGQCSKICQFNAIVILGKRAMVFPELCHGCAGCWLVCPTGAITESKRATGTLEIGHAGKLQFIQGLLNVGEAMSPPVIRDVKAHAPEADILIIDSPPGSSCPVVESVRGSDYLLLVTEPTPFGLNDLMIAVDMARALKLDFGIIINRADSGDSFTMHTYCRKLGIEILAEIPDDRRVAEAYSRGETAFESVPEYKEKFFELLEKIKSVVGRNIKK
ncbi:MAG: ATP-binding protein [Victivallales bacterium]